MCIFLRCPLTLRDVRVPRSSAHSPWTPNKFSIKFHLRCSLYATNNMPLYTCDARFESRNLQTELVVACYYKPKFGDLSPSLSRQEIIRLEAKKKADQEAAPAAAAARAIIAQPPGHGGQKNPDMDGADMDMDGDLDMDSAKDQKNRPEKKPDPKTQEKFDQAVESQGQRKVNETKDVHTTARARPLPISEKRDDSVIVELDVIKSRVLLWHIVNPSDAANPASAEADGLISADSQVQSGCCEWDTPTMALRAADVYTEHIAVPESSSNEAVFVSSGYKNTIEQSVRRGVNVAILAYGQTGSGKTYTLGTSVDLGDGRWTPGLGQMSVACFVTQIREREAEERGDGVEYTIRYSAYEVRLGKVRCCHLHAWLGCGDVVTTHNVPAHRPYCQRHCVIKIITIICSPSLSPHA